MSPSRESIVAEARRWLGTPYRHQAATLGAGCDCLGLVRGIYTALYGTAVADLPAYGADWRDLRHADDLLRLAETRLVPAASEIEPGQILLFRLNRLPLAKHCGIATDGGRFIHAVERLGVVEIALDANWRRRITQTFDFP
jgi:NlpC/P60 family putative phage cell wall peptidase